MKLPPVAIGDSSDTACSQFALLGQKHATSSGGTGGRTTCPPTGHPQRVPHAAVITGWLLLGSPHATLLMQEHPTAAAVAAGQLLLVV